MMWLWQWLRTKWKGNAWDIPVANLGEVVPGRLYRSAEPGGRALEAAGARLGLRTVLDLRPLGSDEHAAAKTRAESSGLAYVNIPMDDHGTIPLDDFRRALDVIDDPSRLPVLVHCQGGRHRTGAVVAVSRMWREGWPLRDAMEEARRFGFYAAMGHEGVRRSIEEADTNRPTSPRAR